MILGEIEVRLGSVGLDQGRMECSGAVADTATVCLRSSSYSVCRRGGHSRPPPLAANQSCGLPRTFHSGRSTSANDVVTVSFWERSRWSDMRES